MRVAALAGLVWLSGCQALGFCPRCKKEAPVVLTEVVPCVLPERVSLPPVKAMPKEQCPEAVTVCLDRENAANLAARLDILYGWIREARASCEPTFDDASQDP